MKERGITLIALVITLIVLLILAGVSIATLTGDNGILTKATKAKEETKIATDEEQRKLTIAEAAMNFENKEYIDKNGDNAMIPAGFAVSQVEGENIINDGLVIIDSNGNEFVWIPVTSKENYAPNKNFSNIIISTSVMADEKYLPDDIDIPEGKTEQEVETELVTKTGIQGFYISRYEAGDGSASEERTESSGTAGTLVSKKGAHIYNYISQVDAKAKSKTFVVKDNSKVKSGLCTGIQWDMVMAFISRKERLDGTNQSYDVTNSSSNRHSGTVTTSGKNVADKVCNIYDLEGNVCEYVAEKDGRGTGENELIHRGGVYGVNNGSACNRLNCLGNANKNNAFRFVLYVIMN